MPDNDLIRYISDDEESQLIFREHAVQFRLIQSEMAEPYQSGKQSILDGKATVMEDLTVQAEKKWQHKHHISQACWHTDSVVNRKFTTVSGIEKAFCYV